MAFGGLEYTGAFTAAFGMSVTLTPMLRRWALRRAIVDAPDGGRKQQNVAVPYLGGVAIAFAVTIVLLFGVGVGGLSNSDWAMLGGVLAPALLLALIGFLDDLRGLTPGMRFVVQSLAAVITAVALSLAGTRSQLTGFAPIDIAITVLWVVGVTNALNLLDNMDALAGGATAIAALAYFAIAAVNGQYLIAALALAIAGGCAGFLVWNRPPARIYMGDAGALFLGFMLAAVSIRIHLNGQPRLLALFAPLVVLFLPVLDTTLVVLSRLRRGISPFVGGRDHLSHRLLDRGRTVPQAGATLHAVAVLAGLCAIVMSRSTLGVGLLILVVLAVAFAWILTTALLAERHSQAQEP